MKVQMTNALIAKVAIMLLQDCGRRFPSLGAMQSQRAPQKQALINATSPVVAESEKRMSIRQDGSGNPEAAITLDYNPKRQVAGGAIRTARGVVNGEATTDKVSVTTGFGIHREYTKNFTTYDMIKLTAETEAYLKSANAGNVNFDLANFPALAIIGDEILTTIESILTPINQQIVASLTAHVGYNFVTGDALSPDISLYNAEGMMRTDFWDFINAIKRRHNYSGRLIIVGGDTMAGYLDKRNIVAVNNLGLNQQAMLNTIAADFFYDPEIEAQLGTGEVIIQEANASCFQTILEHAYMIKQKRMANTSYGKMAINLGQYSAPTFNLDMDLRARENDTAWPTLDVTPSVHAGMFLRPAGYFANYGGWQNVTGTWRAKLIA